MPKVNISLLAQILQLVDRNIVDSLVRKHGTDKHSKGLNTWTHLVSMLFCQLAGAKGIREIANGLRSATGNLSHLGVKQAPCKSSISYLNKHRNWQFFKDLYFKLLEKFEGGLQRKRLYAKRLKRKIFIVDSTVVPLCLKIFDWALFRQRKGAIKLHTLLDYDMALPVYMHMTEGKTHDIKVARALEIPRGSVIVADRAYVDFKWLNDLDSRGVFFVTRLKDKTQIEIVEQYLTDDRAEHILEDADIRLTGFYTQNKYPDKLRIVKVYDEVNDLYLILLTNNMSWTAETISELYKARWDIETFFKHIKQVLRIKTFVGTSPNAVLIQVWTAMIIILLLRLLKAKAKYGWHLSNLVAFLRMNLFVKINMWEWIDEPFIRIKDPPKQPELFATY